MRLKKIGAICSASKTVQILEKADEAGVIRRYIGTGSALYEVGDLGEGLSLEIMQTIFDVPEKDRREWNYIERVVANYPLLDDVCDHEEQLSVLDLLITHRGDKLVSLCTDRSIVFIDADYLAPLRDEIKAGGVAFFKRPGNLAITVKDGMCKAIAAICPTQIDDDKFVEQMSTIYRLLTAPTEETPEDA